MSTEPERRERKLGFQDGVRFAITWLGKLAGEMNDPHARAVLNAAAFSLGNERKRNEVVGLNLDEGLNDTKFPRP